MNMENKQLSALAEGVKLIGIGKHGSKKLPEELIVSISKELNEGDCPSILVGAFFGALLMKEIEPQHMVLESFSGKGSLTNAEIMWESILSDAPEELKPLGIKLLEKEELTAQEAHFLGDFLLSDNLGETFKGLAMSILRIRYETIDEYKGLYDAIIKTASSHQVTFDDKIRIQLAEPFDGVNRSNMITPIIAQNLQALGYSAIVSCGKSSGPKNVLNTRDIYKRIGGSFLKTDTKTEGISPKYGWVFDQEVFYPALKPWVEKRRTLMKRPYLATIEKVLNPFNADTLLTSVFHIPYLKKMTTLGFMAGFKSVLVLKRGQEGTLAPSLSKATGLLCAIKQTDGTILTHEINTKGEKYSPYKLDTDDAIENYNPENNIQLLKNYLANGTCEDDVLNKRVTLATMLYKEGLDWIKENE